MLNEEADGFEAVPGLSLELRLYVCAIMPLSRMWLSACFATRGQNHLYRSSDIPMREGYSPLIPVPFAEEYDED